MRTGAAGRPSSPRLSSAVTRLGARHSLKTCAGCSVDEVDGGLERLVLVEPVLGDEPGEEAGVERGATCRAGPGSSRTRGCRR